MCERSAVPDVFGSPKYLGHGSAIRPADPVGPDSLVSQHCKHSKHTRGPREPCSSASCKNRTYRLCLSNPSTRPLPPSLMVMSHTILLNPLLFLTRTHLCPLCHSTITDHITGCRCQQCPLQQPQRLSRLPSLPHASFQL
jgi:hypothetical protein